MGISYEFMYCEFLLGNFILNSWGFTVLHIGDGIEISKSLETSEEKKAVLLFGLR